VERIATGINALDRLIEGGIPRSTSGIIVSDRRSPGGFFGQQILWNALQRGLTCVYFHTRYSSERELMEEMAGSGWDIQQFLKKGNLRISDYVALAGLNADEEKSGEFGRDVRKVEGRIISSAKLTKLTSQSRCDFALFDDIDLLLRKLDKAQFVEWAGTVAKFQKDQGGVALAVVYQVNLPSDVMNLIDRLGSDCTIELRTNETSDGSFEHYFRVTRMKATSIARHGWTPYTTGKDGISAA
jgi:KaiC/GvpD/RAD55 family RecA-like ATPase